MFYMWLCWMRNLEGVMCKIVYEFKSRYFPGFVIV